MASYSVREAVFLALSSAWANHCFLIDSLNRWKEESQPSPKDFSLAREMAYGTMRMARALDFQATQLSHSGKVKIKKKDQIILRMALYQAYYMDKIPLYAIISETHQLIKTYSHPSLKPFINAILNRIPDMPLSFPDDLSIRYSYPPYFIDQLKKVYDPVQLTSILEAGNAPSRTTARMRRSGQMTTIKDSQELFEMSQSPDVYIQNATPAYLFEKLCQNKNESPHAILDLCSSPGGKLLLAHEHFPEAKLVANDISEEKLQKIQENLNKYQVKASLTCFPGESYPLDKHFDLIILDVPCSNSGVLNKRPEARWRLDESHLHELHQTQWALLKQASQLLNPKGCLFYMTCSILAQENEEMVQQAVKKLGLKMGFSETILPNLEGWDGGYGCELSRL